MRVDQAESVDFTTDVISAPLLIVMLLFLFIALCGGRLLPTWMFLNSMQLILHVILIRTDMPSHAFFFIHNFLNKFRLKFDWTEEMIDD